jgi:hypothetical protein
VGNANRDFLQNMQKEMTMRKTIFSVLAALVVIASTTQMTMASERHAHKAYRDNFRGAHNQLIVPSYAAPGTGYGMSTGGNWRDDAKFEPSGS